MNFIKTLVGAAALAMVAGTAGAATFMSDETCSNSDVSSSTGPADDCWGLSDMNAASQNLDLTGGDTFDGDPLFGRTDWEDIQSNPDFQGEEEGMFDVVANSYDIVAVILKSANTFAAYLFEDGLSGTLMFETANERGLSNYRVVGVNEVPLPASALLLIGGLGGLMVLRRRK